MTEETDPKPEPEQPNLGSLLDGLDLTPNWAKGDPGVHADSPSRGRSAGGPRAPKSSRRSIAGVRVKPKREDGVGAGDEPRQHRGDRDGGRRSFGGDDRRGPARRPQRVRLPVHVDFIPDKNRLSKVVAIIRKSNRAFPLEEIAGKFMQDPRFISIKFTVREKAPDAEEFHFYQCRANNMVFASREQCEAYIVEAGLPQYFDVSEQEVEPPAGNFVCVGRVRASSTLVGPPNWHGYARRLEEIRSEESPNVSVEEFSADVEMIHEPEVIDAWKEQQRVVKMYRLKAEEVEKPASSAVEQPAAEEIPPGVGPVSDLPAEESQQAQVDAPVESEPSSEIESSGEEPPSEEHSPQEEPIDDRPFDLTLDQADKLFRERFLPQLISESRRAIMPGYLVERMRDPNLQSSVQFHLRREQDHPSSIVFALRPAFKHMRLHLFRYDGQLHISGIHPNRLALDEHIAADIRRILQVVEEKPLQPAKDVLQQLAEGSTEPTADLVSHLHWLIEKGHLIEFSNGALSLPHSKPKGL